MSTEFEAGIPGSWALEASLDEGELIGFLNLLEDQKIISAPSDGQGENTFPNER